MRIAETKASRHEGKVLKLARTDLAERVPTDGESVVLAWRGSSLVKERDPIARSLHIYGVIWRLPKMEVKE